MTTPTRPLPQGVEIRQYQRGWHPCCHITPDGQHSVLSRSRNAWTHRYAHWTGDDGWPTEAAATAAFWAHHDRQPENQAKAEPKYDSPGYRAGYAAGLESAERVIASLTARVAALEAKDTPTITDVEQYHEEIDGKPSPGPRLIEGMNQLRDAVQNGTLDQLPTTVVARCGDRTVRYTREPESVGTHPPLPSPSAEVTHREPVVGMAYMNAGEKVVEYGDWHRITSGGIVQFNRGTAKYPQWVRSHISADSLRSAIRSGYFVPVPGYRVEDRAP